MTSYKIKIKGIHCQGCKGLIAMSLEDEGFTNVDVTEDSATFESYLEIKSIEGKLQETFKLLKSAGYYFEDLQLA
jgi:copper chaperone CopZ